VTLATLVMAYVAAFSSGYIFPKDATSFWHWCYETSILKHSNFGAVASILGLGRTKMDCNKIYCHYQQPQKFLEEIGFADDLEKPVLSLVLYLVVYRVATYLCMRHRLKNK